MRPVATFLFALLGATALAASPAPEWLGGGVTDKFEVLDLSVTKGWAVIKLVEHDDASSDGYSTGSADCKYGGMTAQPLFGVTLATWDLDAGRTGESFVVYAKVADEAECTPAETSTQNLASAKAAATAKGLDVTRKPAPILPKDGVFTLPVGDKTVVATATSGVREDDSGMEYTAWAKLTVGGETLYEVEDGFNPMGAGHMSLSFTQALVVDGKAVFVLRQVYGNMRSSDGTSWGLTRPVPLGSATANVQGTVP